MVDARGGGGGVVKHENNAAVVLSGDVVGLGVCVYCCVSWFALRRGRAGTAATMAAMHT